MGLRICPDCGGRMGETDDENIFECGICGEKVKVSEEIDRLNKRIMELDGDFTTVVNWLEDVRKSRLNPDYDGKNWGGELEQDLSNKAESGIEW